MIAGKYIKVHNFCVHNNVLSSKLMILQKDIVNLGDLVYIKEYTLGGNENMSKKEIVVSNVSEKHDNPIAELVQVACQFDSHITLESENRRINAKSIMGIMAFNPSKGMTVNIITEGDDEEEALFAMEKFLVCE
ncbi:phosphocarrier protein HPr [Lachnospiraceae bacterium]|nr:phosphocarrier protein HPr [Lachnospiraceae bacterium]